jgi:hypothetical protein
VLRHALVQRGVARVQQPVEVAGSPESADLDTDVENAGDLANDAEGYPIEVSALDERNERTGHLGPVGDVLLAPSASDPDSPKGGPDPSVVHTTMVTGHGPRPIYCGSTGRYPATSGCQGDRGWPSAPASGTHVAHAPAGRHWVASLPR